MYISTSEWFFIQVKCNTFVFSLFLGTSKWTHSLLAGCSPIATIVASPKHRDLPIWSSLLAHGPKWQTRKERKYWEVEERISWPNFPLVFSKGPKAVRHPTPIESQLSVISGRPLLKGGTYIHGETSLLTVNTGWCFMVFLEWRAVVSDPNWFEKWRQMEKGSSCHLL